ncbi:MAG: superoxide dismutase [Bacteroidales bacterium]|nr:superoxide dismutase [Bacteroidales bacterium]
MPFLLPELPYDLTDLSPFISMETLEFHHGKHHKTYVDNLNNLIPGTEFENADLETIVRKAEGAIFNNGAQVWNHTFYFESMSGDGKRKPSGALLMAIESSFGSFDNFMEQFMKAAVTLFGSGWAWFVKNNDGTLQITQESNAGNPLRKGLKPLLTCDVWEHAYYIDYRNRRADYVRAYWELIDWKVIEERF